MKRIDSRRARIPSASDALYTDADDLEYEQIALRMIPYYAFTNRKSGDLLIRFPRS